MRNLFTHPSNIVEAGAVRSGVASRPQTLQIVNGLAWVTIEGEPHDYWLLAGDIIELRPGRLVVVEAGGRDVVLKMGMQGSLGIVEKIRRQIRALRHFLVCRPALIAE